MKQLPEGARQVRGRIWSVGARLKAAGSDEQRIVAGYASRPTVDRVQEVVDTNAFAKSIEGFKANPVMLYMHDPRRPIGKFTTMDLTPDGLFVSGELAKGTQDAEDAWQLIKQGVLKSFSIGFRELDGSSDEKDVYHITDLELYEISVVSIPANREALFTVANGKLLDIEMLDHRHIPQQTKGVIPYRKYPTQDPGAAWDAGAARRSLAAYAKTGDGYDFSKYKLGFTYVADGAQTNLTGYSLPHHIVEGGELKTNLRGCRAVIGVLAGARGGVGIPDAARSGVYNHVARHIKSDFNADVPAYSDLAAAILRDEAVALEHLGVTAEEIDKLLAEVDAAPSTSITPAEEAELTALSGDMAAQLMSLSDRINQCEAAVQTMVQRMDAMDGSIDAQKSMATRIDDLEALFHGFVLREVKKVVSKAGIDLDALMQDSTEQAGDAPRPGPTEAPTA